MKKTLLLLSFLSGISLSTIAMAEDQHNPAPAPILRCSPNLLVQAVDAPGLFLNIKSGTSCALAQQLIADAGFISSPHVTDNSIVFVFHKMMAMPMPGIPIGSHGN